MEHTLNEETLAFFNQEIYAKAAVLTLYNIIQKTDERDVFEKVFSVKNHILEQNQNNVFVKNLLTYFLYNLPQKGIKVAAEARYKEIMRQLPHKSEQLSKLGSKKIKDKSRIFLHSVDNNTYSIIKEASKNRSFSVNLLEHAPHNLGKHTYEELKKKKIDAKLFTDLEMFEAIKESDICFLGAKSINQDKNAVVKTGSNLAAEISNKHNIPVYVCAPSFLYDNDKVTSNRLVGVEELKKENITAFITEYGIHSPAHLSEELRFHNSWLFL
jgi:translation initiation factor 2B subunit (eIF-2B alpha/beta/delta family)